MQMKIRSKLNIVDGSVFLRFDDARCKLLQSLVQCALPGGRVLRRCISQNTHDQTLCVSSVNSEVTDNRVRG